MQGQEYLCIGKDLGQLPRTNFRVVDDQNV